MHRLILTALGLALAAVVACTKSGGPEDRRQVEAAIQEHLRQAPNLQPNSFTTQVEDVEFHGRKAEATVRFQSKETPTLAVRVRYTLSRDGDHWRVHSSMPVGGQEMSPAPAQSAPSSAAPVPSH